MFILTEKNQAEAVRQALRQRLEGTGVTVAHPGGERPFGWTGRVCGFCPAYGRYSG